MLRGGTAVTGSKGSICEMLGSEGMGSQARTRWPWGGVGSVFFCYLRQVLQEEGVEDANCEYLV